MLNRLRKNQTKFITITLLIFALLFGVVFLFMPVSSATVANGLYGIKYAGQVGLSSADIRVSIIKIIRVVLGVLGIIALAIVIYGGFVWMTAQGNTDKIARAKKILLNALIGLIIILMAFAIVQYIFHILSGGGGSGGSGGDVCLPGDIRGSCELCTGPHPPGHWQWQSGWPGCGPPVPTHFILNSVQTSHAGANDKEDVYWCSKIQNIFNRNVDAASVDAAHSDPALISDPLRIQTTSTIPLVADGDWQVRGNVAVFTPKNNEFVNKNTGHQQHLPGWNSLSPLLDDSGKPLKDCSLSASCETIPPPEVIWNFYVGNDGDVVDPYITSTYPQSDKSNPSYPDINVSMDPIIGVNFSEAIDAFTVLDTDGIHPYPGHIYIEELDGAGGSVVTQLANSILIVQMRGNGKGFKIHLDPPNLLKAFTYYRVTVQDIEDLCGNKMNPNNYNWEFATNDRLPGISSYYPQGSNVCPDTKINVTFNTSMYYNSVRMRISEGANIWNYTLEPSKGITSISDARGQFHILDMGTPISTHYTSYEFIPASDLSENTLYDIYIETDKIIDASGNILTHSWQFTVTDLENCVCTPQISYLSKSQGPVGECITLNGYCFRGTVAKPATIDYIHFDTTNATIGSGYTGRYVGTSVPLSFSPGDKPITTLSIAYAAGNNVPPSNGQQFLITAGTANGPCLWSVQPSSGRRGLIGLKLSGDRFGDTDSTRQVIFTPPATAVYNVPSTDWANQTIQNVVVPMATEDGEVFVRNDVGDSNGIYFDAYWCGDGNVDAGEECDGSNLNLKDCTDFGFVGGTLGCYMPPILPGGVTECSFNKSACSNAPQVVENGLCQLVCNGGANNGSICYNDTDCPGGSCQIDVLPSPNPYKNADNVCLNAVISADFNTDIDLTTITASNIYMFKCADDDCLNIMPGTIAGSLAADGQRSFRFTPTVNLDQDSTYQMIIKGGSSGISSLAGIQMEKDYSWHFKTKNDSALCPIELVYVSPKKNTLGANQSDNSYHASAIASFLSTNCSIINGNSYNWLWSIGMPDLGVTVKENLFDDSDATVKTATKQGQVRVIAETESKQGWGDLKISFDTCSFNPSICNTNCPGSTCDISQDRCTPVVNSLSPNSGPVGRWITVQGCYFKNSRGGGHVDFLTTPVNTYPCGEIWTDTQILVEVPDTLLLTDYPVIVTDSYGLNSNADVGYEVISDCLTGVPLPPTGVPGLCSLNPEHGKPTDSVILSGENFGSSKDTVTFNGLAAPIGSWGDTSIDASVPAGATTGDVIVSVDSCPSDALNFKVDSGNVGDPCDADPTTPLVCDKDNDLCWPGNYCDETSCTCQSITNANIISGSEYPPPDTFPVCRNIAVSATFDQLMRDATINESNIKLWENAGDEQKSSQCIYISMSTSSLGPQSDFSRPFLFKNNLFSKIIDLFKKVFKPSVRAAAGAGNWWCPVSGVLTSYDVESGVKSCTNPQGCTVFIFSPYDPLTSGNYYEIHIKGGSEGVKSILGGELNTRSPNKGFMGSSYFWGFSGGGEICTIDHVDVDVSFINNTNILTRHNTSYDYFTCAGRDDCADDINGAAIGNQHLYVAQAKDKDNVLLSAAYEWSEYDEQNLIEVGPPTDIQDPHVTANPLDGQSIVRVKAFDMNTTDDIHYGTSTAAVNVTNFICQNPWPSLATFPYQDTGSNCNLGAGSCINMNFSTFYCRDFGHDNDFCLGGDRDGLGCTDNTECPGGGECVDFTIDDLPALTYPGNIRGTIEGYCVGGPDHGQSCQTDSECGGRGYCYNTLKEFMFLYDKGWCSASGILCQVNGDCPADETCDLFNDSIGIRIYRNDEHLSPSAWYQKYLNNSGNYSQKNIDGYQAISSGRTHYVNFAVDSDPSGSHSIFTDMFLLSYTDNYQPLTLDIYDQLLANLRFNTNGIDNVRMCTNGAYCEKDSDCPSGESCDAEKLKLSRDVIRMGALSEIIYHLDLYRGECSAHNQLACLKDDDCPDYADLDNPEYCVIKNNTYPLLEAGTYLENQSVSVWDSWNNTFASLLGSSLLLDPLNEVVDCGEGYNEECWNEEALIGPSDLRFQCNPGSHMLHYYASDATDSYVLYTNMEYSNINWLPAPKVGSFQTSFGQPCSPGAYNLLYLKVNP